MTPLLERIAADPNLLAASVFVVCLAGAGIFAAVWGALFGQEERRLRRRLERLHVPHTAGAEQSGGPVESLRRNRSDSSIASFDRLIKRFVPNIGLLRQRLARSGWPLKVGDYLLICLALAAVTMLGMWLVLDLSLLIDALVAVVFGIGLPHFALQQQIGRRQKKFISLMPEALDLIVRGIRSGLPASEALKTIGDEIDAPVGPEFRQVTDQMRIGVALDEAMWTAARRLGIAEFNFLVISLSIQQETGGNLAEILEKLSDMVRRREQMRLKVKAMSSEARASAMIIGALPFIMCGVISFVNPGYMNVLFTDPRGWMMIGVGLTSLLIGLAVMAKMIRFDI
ncbi:MAG TPA: type II secretion system F family protein [Geminicoccaceae bacterium]|nr:type II secretion system F family protein [Geminicoccaceae bacterium]